MNYSYVSLLAVLSVGVLLGVPRFAPVNQGRMKHNAQAQPGTCGWSDLIVLEGDNAVHYKDVIIWNHGVKEWDWTLSNTNHTRGIQIAALQEFIDQVDVVVLTQGVDLVLQVPQATIDYVARKGKVCYVGETSAMIKLFNRLIDEGKKVGGLFHSTC
jgi:hypothetical protein